MAKLEGSIIEGRPYKKIKKNANMDVVSIESSLMTWDFSFVATNQSKVKI